MKKIIVNFHGVGEPPSGTVSTELKFWWSESAFHAALDLIRTSIDDSGDRISITFDDGNLSDARIALPALYRRGLTARFFICAGRLGIAGYLDQSAIRDLRAAGMNIGSHGMNHVNWRQVSPHDLDVEIFGSIDSLEQICDQEVLEVAIPFGSYDRRVIQKLKQTKIRSVYTSDGGYACSNTWLKPRNTLDQTHENKNFVSALTRANTPFSRLRRKLVTLYKMAR